MDSHPATWQAIETKVKKGIQAGWWWYMTLIPALSRGRSRQIYMSSNPAWSTRVQGFRLEKPKIKVIKMIPKQKNT